MNNKKERENEWHGHPIVIFTGLLVLYTASNSVMALFHF
jgi:hypothetical protein